MNMDVCTRLYQTPIRTIRQDETDCDALISDLPTDTLRWIKMRRKLDCEAKMVLSHNRESQLRDIFNGIDVGKHGSIDLIELEEAVTFVKERLDKKLGTFEGFNQIIKVFKSMDVNGDGKVDFREFTNAMSGSTKSALAKASEQDVANLHRCFLEFGVLKARRHAIAKINDYTGLSFSGEHNIRLERSEEEEAALRRRKSVKSVDSTLVVVDDLKKYNLFRTLFEEQRDTTSSAHTKELEELVIEEDERRLSAQELLLKDFLDSNRALGLVSGDPEKEAEFDRLQSRLHEARLKAAEDFAKDPDALALQARHEEGVRFFAERRRNQRPVTAPNPFLRTIDGKQIKSSISPYNTYVPPPESDARGELNVKLSAKREAYDILRSIRYMNVPEKQTYRGMTALAIPPYDPQSLSLQDSGSRSSSNLPTSRKQPALPRRGNALRKSQSLDAMLNRPGGGGKASTPPVTVRLTSHAAILSSSPSSPIVTARIPHFLATASSRPTTANYSTWNSFNSLPEFAGRPSSSRPVTATATATATSAQQKGRRGVTPLREEFPCRTNTCGFGAVFTAPAAGSSGGDKSKLHSRLGLRSPKLMAKSKYY